ncbi:uncharacterized protein LOC124924965 [Impatiens glandulifera]|uniref:uncharacterized protein LOC124924965 n=1 Tax=Impatiens glandulifera TaxID=253017 RepID=UPI001FB18F99|nr:uncharacterized protein LOC124924965 [Impatiens glandulifera]
MDIEQVEMKSLGFCGTCKESFKLLLTWKKIFFQIILALILPLSLIFLTYEQASNFLFTRIMGDTINLDHISKGTRSYDVISRRISSEWLSYWVIKIFYFTFVLVFSLLSTAAVTYTVASIYARRDIAFRIVMSVVPKVWKRLVITFICTYLAFFLYNTAFVIFLVIWMSLLVQTSAGLPSLIIVSIVYLLGFAYLNVVWQLTSVVSVLENYKGFKAMRKSKELIKGKFWLGFFVLVFPGLVMVGIEVGFLILVINLNVVGVLVVRVLLGFLFVVLNLIAILYALVIEAVLYFVCKSYHNEVVDRPSLTTHLSREYNNDFSGTGSPKDVQMSDVNNV